MNILIDGGIIIEGNISIGDVPLYVPYVFNIVDESGNQIVTEVASGSENLTEG